MRYPAVWMITAGEAPPLRGPINQAPGAPAPRSNTSVTRYTIFDAETAKLLLAVEGGRPVPALPAPRDGQRAYQCLQGRVRPQHLHRGEFLEQCADPRSADRLRRWGAATRYDC